VELACIAIGGSPAVVGSCENSHVTWRPSKYGLGQSILNLHNSRVVGRA